MTKSRRKPAYTLHRPTGQARVRIGGKDHYLGEYGSPESRDRYDDLIAEWFASDGDVSRYSLTIDDLALLFMAHAEGYYRHKDGTPTGETTNLRHALGFVIRSHGRTRARDFGPLKLKDVRDAMISAGMCRSNVNRQIHRVKRLFAWGVENERVPAAVYQSLQAVAGLRRGRSKARESAPVAPVPQGTVDATLPHLPGVVADMVRLQLLCGARPGEICSIRPCDITRGLNGVWTYRPATHKTEHHGRERRIFIGPEGQAVLSRYLDRDPEAYCFWPAEADAERNAVRRANRRSPLTPSQAARKRKGRTHRARYTKDTYNRAVGRGCEMAFGMPAELRNVGRTVARLQDVTEKQRDAEKLRLSTAAAAWRAEYCWSPNQLRHSRATAIRERYGLEAAATVLGHADPRVTEIYAERDFAMAAKVMREIG
ncbi:site-specific integrase [Planctellipticum variicoloris]|uniref:site-specific integrase n=1 Tax=Planctellipticum variicoloris TaxID=3064265 RepID=UPI003013759D|nr:site-specific integrase [Planctomycetaceae bacterium SH412]